MNEIEIQCPYCWEIFSISVSSQDGQEQTFTYDCEVCCNPMTITATRLTAEDEESEHSSWSLNIEKGD